MVLDTPTTFCVDPAQLDACGGLTDGVACTFGSRMSTCHGGACLPDDCGNGLVDSLEVCDDGNTVSTDDCAADCSSTLACGNGIVDVARAEQCDQGDDHVGHDGCTSNCKSETLHWSPLLEDRPQTRTAAAAAYDVRAGEVVLFGGRSNVPPPDYYLFHNDTYGWDGIRWQRRATSVAPSPRDSMSITYDEAREALLMYSAGETWTLRGGVWQLENPTTRPPTGDGSVVYERARQRVILFAPAGTWAWDGTNWNELPQSDMQVKQRSGAALAYDDTRNAVVMFGGTLDLSTALDDTWELVGDTWTKRTPTSSPPARKGAQMAYSPRDGELLLVGGNTRVSNQDVPARDVWRYNGTRWEQDTDAPFPAIDLNTGVAQYVGHAVVTDPVRRVVVVAGSNGKVHEWDGTAWRTPAGGIWTDRPVARTPRFFAAAAVDPRSGRFVTYGGEYVSGGTFGEIDETWVYDGRWLQVNPSVTPGRFGAAMAYDPLRDELVLFGGCTAAGSQFQDTAILKPNGSGVLTWTVLTSLGTKPPGRCHAAMYYDDTLRKVVLWSGMDGQYSPIDDMWTWDGTAWAQFTQPATRPLPRYLAASGYDPIAHQLVVLGGGGIDTGISVNFDDVWSWDGSSWHKITSPGPGYRSNARFAWDAARKRLVLVGGTAGTSAVEDVWELDLATQTWEPQGVSGLARQAHVLVSAYDNRGGVFLYGGFTTSASDPNAIKDDLWHLTRDSDASYETCRLQDADGDGLTSCEDPDCWNVCTPFCPPGASCPNLPKLCGDGTCNATLEQCTTCPADCGACM